MYWVCFITGTGLKGGSFFIFVVVQAPTTSLLSLSSPDDSPPRESETISSLPVPDDSDAVTIVHKESSESLSKNDSKTKLVTKQVSIEQVFSRRKKKSADATVNLEGMEEVRGRLSVSDFRGVVF